MAGTLALTHLIVFETSFDALNLTLWTLTVLTSVTAFFISLRRRIKLKSNLKERSREHVNAIRGLPESTQVLYLAKHCYKRQVLGTPLLRSKLFPETMNIDA